jgi:Domain of unknown function (DUF5076)
MSKKHDHDHHHHDHSHDIHPHQLMPPHEVFHDANAGELMRAWITNGHLSLALHAGAFPKPEIWGHVLAGMAEQVAASMAEMGNGTTAANLEEIRKTAAADLAKAAAKHSPLAAKSGS